MMFLKKRFLKLFDFWPFLVIILIVSVFFWPYFIKGQIPIPGDFVVGVYYPWLDYKWGYPTGVPVKNPIMADVVSFIFPMQTLAIDLIKSNELPLWNPYILAGTPLLANFQSAPFSPTNWLYFLFDKLDAWSFQIILQHVLAALFSYLLLRYWKVSKIASVLGGVIYAFSGFNLIWSQWNGHSLTAAFIPLLLLFSDKWLTSGRWFSGVGVTFSFACLFLSGYPQVALYASVAVGLLYLVRLRLDKTFFLRTLLLGFFLLLGVGLVSFQFLPGAELLKYSQREIEPHPFDWAFLPWEKVITFVAPDYFGNHVTNNYWGPQDYTSNTGFVGIVTFILASISLYLIKQKKEVVFLLLMVVVSLVFAFPTPVSIYLWRSGLLGFNAASAHRSLVIFNFGLALLAGFGLDYLRQKKPINLFRVIAFPFILLLTFGCYSVTYFLLSRNNPFLYSPLVENIPAYLVSLRNLVIPVGWLILTTMVLFINNKSKKVVVWLVLPLVCFELFRFGWKFTPFSPRNIVFPSTPVLDFLQKQTGPVRVTGSKVIPINLRMTYGLESLEGYDAVYPSWVSRFISAVNSGGGGAKPIGRYGNVDNPISQAMDLVNTKYHLVLKKDLLNNLDTRLGDKNSYQSQRFRTVFEDGSVAVLESKNSLPRAFMVYDWEVVDSDTEVLDKLLSSTFPISKKVILNELPPLLLEKVNKPNTNSKVTYKIYKANESEIVVETTGDGLLFVSDTWYPGWKAYLDGKETKLYKADYMFRAVVVLEGKHTIRFIYQPASFIRGLKISVVSLLLLTLTIVTKKIWEKRLH